MNPLNGITDWSSIGAAAANHLWQSTLFIGVCWLATRWLRKNNASIRHWIWLAASVKFLFPCPSGCLRRLSGRDRERASRSAGMEGGAEYQPTLRCTGSAFPRATHT